MGGRLQLPVLVGAQNHAYWVHHEPCSFYMHASACSFPMVYAFLCVYTYLCCMRLTVTAETHVPGVDLGDGL
jgi:hypothetical protein